MLRFFLYLHFWLIFFYFILHLILFVESENETDAEALDTGWFYNEKFVLPSKARFFFFSDAFFSLSLSFVRQPKLVVVEREREKKNRLLPAKMIFFSSLFFAPETKSGDDDLSNESEKVPTLWEWFSTELLLLVHSLRCKGIIWQPDN